MTSYTSSLTVRFEVIVDEFVFILVLCIIYFRCGGTRWDVCCYITNVECLTTASEFFEIISNDALEGRPLIDA